MRPIPRSAIRFAAELRAPVRVFSVARVYGVAFAFPNPWLRPSRDEWKEQHEIAALAVESLKRKGIEADGHVVLTVADNGPGMPAEIAEHAFDRFVRGSGERAVTRGSSGLGLPIVIRMEGTNVELGRKVLAESGFNFTVADGMKDAAEKVVAAAGGKQ